MQLVESMNTPLQSKGDKILSGLFAEMDTFNQNGRKYPESIYEQAYEELLPKIKEKRLLGELDHPLEYDEIRLTNVSHAITECHMEETRSGVKQIYGTVELLDTPAGLIAQSLVKAGIPLGISSRGVGATKQVRDGVEVTSLKLITYDLVAEPSFANAILSPDQSKGLSDSLEYIESNLPLNESIETQSVRGMIENIRESLLRKKTNLTDEVDIDTVELEALKNLLETSQVTIKSDTQIMVKNRQQIKDLQEQLKESDERNRHLMRNMSKLQEAYNTLHESVSSQADIESLTETINDLKKKLAVERRGISYDRVSSLLEGATSEEEIEERLDSLASVGRKRQSLKIDNRALTESANISREKKLDGLAAIVARI